MWYRRLFNLASIVLVLLIGVAAGAYYHNEIGVIWRSFFPAPSAEPAPADSEPASSTLSFTRLEQPLPLVYSDTLEEARLQEYLKEGAVVLPLGTSFGEPGNVVVTAHSSGTAAFGPFRFAFAKLRELEAGQEFRIATPAATYTYRVYSKEIVWPHEVDKLPKGDRSTVTLVTCWPLWTNFKRLLVHAELTGVEYHI